MMTLSPTENYINPKCIIAKVAEKVNRKGKIVFLGWKP
jgi:hypothetical protein